MTQTFSKTRQRAESAFNKVQSQFFAKDHAVEEQDFITQAREAKTLRLRETRLAKESDRPREGNVSSDKEACKNRLTTKMLPSAAIRGNSTQWRNSHGR